MKVELLREPAVGFHNPALGPRPAVVTRSLPYYQSRASRHRYVHRVRSAVLIFHWTPAFKTREHVSFRLWCGMHGSDHHGGLMPEPGPRDVVCATCEGRAVGAGLPSSLLLVTPGHRLRFSPRV